MDPTVAYYDRRGREFAARTRDLDMSALYEPFLALVPNGGCVLDVGCGSGRDSKAFLDRGYQVLSIDASETMAEIASAITGQPARVMQFQEIDFLRQFDGIWACGSLLHVPRSEMRNVIDKLVAALKPNGVFYMSFKCGEQDGVRDGRLFTNYTTVALEEVLGNVTDLVPLRIWTTQDIRAGIEHPDWLNALVRRR